MWGLCSGGTWAGSLALPACPRWTVASVADRVLLLLGNKSLELPRGKGMDTPIKDPQPQRETEPWRAVGTYL